MREFYDKPVIGNGGWRFNESYQERQLAYKEKRRVNLIKNSTSIPRRMPPVVVMLGYPKKMICPNPPPNTSRQPSNLNLSSTNSAASAPYNFETGGVSNSSEFGDFDLEGVHLNYIPDSPKLQSLVTLLEKKSPMQIYFPPPSQVLPSDSDSEEDEDIQPIGKPISKLVPLVTKTTTKSDLFELGLEAMSIPLATKYTKSDFHRSQTDRKVPVRLIPSKDLSFDSSKFMGLGDGDSNSVTMKTSATIKSVPSGVHYQSPKNRIKEFQPPSASTSTSAPEHCCSVMGIIGPETATGTGTGNLAKPKTPLQIYPHLRLDKSNKLIGNFLPGCYTPPFSAPASVQHELSKRKSN